MSCSTFSSLASNTRSSAYFTVWMICPPILKSPNPSKAFLVRHSLYKLNRIGDKQHPSLTSLPIFTLLVSPRFSWDWWGWYGLYCLKKVFSSLLSLYLLISAYIPLCCIKLSFCSSGICGLCMIYSYQCAVVKITCRLTAWLRFFIRNW